METNSEFGNERRGEKRNYQINAATAEVRLPDAPTYQLKLYEASTSGTGVIVHPESKLLPLVRIGQELRVRLLQPVRSELTSGDYHAKVEHLTELDAGPFKGHYLMGLSLKRMSGWWL